ncbi:flavin reductase [bacterium]|nr:flavin reductase [bacterium]
MVDDKLIEAFDTIRSGVYIVTSAYRRKPAGCTVVWLSRVSFDPPLLAVHLAPGGHTFETITKGKRFCVNILGDSGLLLARAFGFASGSTQNKFEDIPYTSSASGSPLLESAIGYIDCKLQSMTPVGDHVMVIGEIIDAARTSEEQPMIYDPHTFYVKGGLRVESLGQQAGE